MDKRLEKIKQQSKENNYTPEGQPRAKKARLQHKGAEEYIDAMGEAYLPSEEEAKTIEKEDKDLPDRIQVGSGFKMNELREKQKQEKALEETQKIDARGEVLDVDLEDSEFGEEVANKLQEMKDKKEKFEIHEAEKKNALNSLWNVSRENKEVIQASYQAFGTEFGLYASIPMLCKGENCVYAQLYPELHGDLTQPGERCPVEIAIIMSRYEKYKEDLNIDPDDAVDMSILRDVIDYDVQIVRAENKVAVEGDFVKDVVVGISQTGVEIMQEQVTAASEYKQRIQSARNKALNLLNSTRKDKAGEKVSFNLDPSTYTKELLSRANKEVIEGDFEEVDEEDDFFEGVDIIEDEPYLQKINNKGVEEDDEDR